MTDGFAADLDSIERFRTGVLSGSRGRADGMRARLAATTVPGHTYTSTEPGQLGFDTHRAILEGFDHRFELVARQLEVLDERLRASAEEYRRQDTSGSDQISEAGSGIGGVA